MGNINFIGMARRDPVTWTAADAEALPSCTECKVSREGQGRTAKGEGRASIGGSKSCTPDQMRDDRKSPIFVSYGECEVKLQGAVGCPKTDEVGAVYDPVCSPSGHIVVDFPAPCGRCSRYQNTGRANVDVLQLQAKERD